MDRRQALFESVVIAIIAAGACARATRLSYSYYVDEVWVVEWARSGNGPFMHVPPLFRGVLRIVVALGGSTAPALRLPAFTAGVLLSAMPRLIADLTAPRLSQGGTIIWTTLLAFSSPIVFYSTQVKQYTLEALVSAVLLGLFIWVTHDTTDPRRWACYAATGSMASTVLYSPVFVAASTAPAFLLLSGYSERSRRETFLMATIAHFAIYAVFLLAYVAYLHPTGLSATHLDDYFVRHPGFWDGSFTFVIHQTRLWFGQAFNLTRWTVPVFALLVTYWLVGSDKGTLRRRWALAIPGLLPPLLVLAASRYHLYPYGEVRLLLFALPGVFLLGALVVSDLIAEAGAKWLWLFPAAYLAVFASNGVLRDTYNATYMRVYDRGPLYEFVVSHHRRGEPLVASLPEASQLSAYYPAVQEDVVLAAEDLSYTAPPHATRFWIIGRSGREPHQAQQSVAMTPLLSKRDNDGYAVMVDGHR